MVREALVSLWWSKGSALAADFACSGFFIAPGYLLTAAHVLDGGAPLWVRPEVGATSSYAITLVNRHPALDVALLKIDVTPLGTGCLSPNIDSRLPAEVRLHGYFEGDLEDGHEIAHALNFDDANKQYRIDIKQPEGHSGSALCIGDRVWGMTIRHYSDPNIHRGCALAMHQFWAWLVGLLPELGKVEPPPQWDEWVARARSGMVQSFKRPVFDKFAGVFARLASGLPEALNAALADPAPASVGENCVEALLALAEMSHAAMLDGSPALAAHECKAAREGFLCAMGSAARLCLDPAQLHAQGIDPNGKLASILSVPAFTIPGAALALRPAPQHSWTLGEEHGIPSLKDHHAFELPLELGEGDDRKQSLAVAAFRCVAGPVKTPDRIDDALRRKIRGRAVSEARQGRALILVLCSQLKPTERDELQTWVAESLGVNLLILDPPDQAAANLYLFDEDILLARIYEFLRLLYEPEWNPT